MPGLALVTSALYMSLARAYSGPAVAGAGAGAGAGVVPLLWHKPSLYRASAGLTLAMVPYTIVFMWSNIHQLHRAGHVLEKCKAGAGELEAAKFGGGGGKTTKQLLDQWGVLNLGRALLTGLGFVVGIWGSLMPDVGGGEASLVVDAAAAAATAAVEAGPPPW